MTVLIVVSLLAACYAAILLYARGYANALDSLALRLHRHARRVRQMHERRQQAIFEAWQRELEAQ